MASMERSAKRPEGDQVIAVLDIEYACASLVQTQRTQSTAALSKTVNDDVHSSEPPSAPPPTSSRVPKNCERLRKHFLSGPLSERLALLDSPDNDGLLYFANLGVLLGRVDARDSRRSRRPTASEASQGRANSSQCCPVKEPRPERAAGDRLGSRGDADS